jgi:RHS repeat-associated protein
MRVRSSWREFSSKHQKVSHLAGGWLARARDSDIDPHSGDGAYSSGVSYTLTTAGGHPAIKMTLDTAWLDSKNRVFPVTVDPSVDAVNSDGTTYVQSGETADNSGSTEIHVGTWDGGTDTARSFLKFDNVSTSLKDDTVLGVRLGIFNTWSYSCSPRTVYVDPVTSSWPLTGAKSWPGPSVGAAVGRATFATGWVPLGSTHSPCPASWQGIGLDQAGTNLVNGWTHGTVPDNGLALDASDSDSYAWKKFASDATGTGDPFLSVTYTTDGARYALGSSKPVKLVEPGQNGAFAIKVTNTGSSTWTASNGYELSYRAYNAQGRLVADHPVFTPMPSTVGPGATVTVDATVDALPAGSYAIDFDMYSGATGSSPVSFSSQGIPPFAIGLYVPQPPPVVSNVYPPTGYVSPVLNPQLSTKASTQSGTISYSFSITCAPLPGQTCPASVITSGTLSTPYWTVPSNEMQWNTPYQWTVTATVNGASTTVGPVTITPEVPQPAITSALGSSTSRQAFDPQSGNYTTTATDAAVASAGPPLDIGRTYNSLDLRTSGAIGAGWSSVLDTALRPDNDGSGNVMVTLPDGPEMRFGQNGNGTYSPPFGSPDVLVKNPDGTWSLRDSSRDRYDFTSSGQLSGIIDQNGLAQAYADNSSGQVTTITNGASGRTLQLIWSTPSGANYPHVASVTTPAPASGQSGSTWTYSYTGDELTKVCAPSGGCTSYSYASGSHYRAAVLDSGPRSYWQLGEASGATTAADEVDANLGTTDGTYSNITLGAAGPLAGSSETAAAFNGSSSSVSLPADLITDGTDVSVGVWFKAASSTASGVLFSYQKDALSSSSGNSDHHDPALYVGGNGELYGEFWNGSVDPIHSTTSVTDGSWHYAVLSGSSASQSLYLDGNLVGTMSGQIDQQDMTTDTVGAGFWQGGWPNAYITVGPALTDPPAGYFSGDIGQVAVYPHALGQPAIAAQYALAHVTSAELSSVTLPSGHVYEQASYDGAAGRLTGYTDPDGGQWAISAPVTSGYKATSDSLGEVVRHVTVTDPAGRPERYGYDALDGGRLVSYSNGADPARTFGYDAAGFLASATDADGNLACFTNDIRGNALTRTWYPVEPASLPGGGTGTVTSCGGSTSSSPACATSGSPCTTFYSYYYDASNPLEPRDNLITGIRDGRSASAADSTYLTSYGYNAAGQLTSQTTPDGRTTSYTYSSGSEPGYSGGTVPAGLILSATTPGGAATSYQYYSDGDLAKATEPSGRYTVYTYDGLGRATTGTVYTTAFPSGLATSYTYTAMNQPDTITYPGVANTVTGATHTPRDSYAYDVDGNLLNLTQADTTGGDPSRVTSYTYDDHGQIATVTEPAGATTGGSSQSQGASSANPQGATTGYAYDTSGDVTSRTDPNGNVYRYSYNEYSEVTSQTLYTPSTSQSSPVAGCSAPATQDPDGGCDLVLDSYAYDPAGLLAAATDALGRTTNYTYDTNQDLIAATTTDASATPTAGRQQTWTHDGAGNLVSQAVTAMSGGAAGTSTVTDYTVNAAGQVTNELIDPTPSGTSDSGYANRTIAYTYDADNHLTSKTTGTSGGTASTVTSYGYDIAGDMTSRVVQDGGTTLKTTWAYDQNAQPLSMTTPDGNTTGYTYNQAGNLATVTGPSVQVQTYTSQTATATRPVTSYGYDTFGDHTQAEDPDGNITATAYDGDGRPVTVTEPGGVTATSSYDQLGDLTGQSGSGAEAATTPRTFGYNPAGQLTSASAPGGTDTFSYNPDGKLTSTAGPSGTSSYDWNSDGQISSQTTAAGTTSYTYDQAGRLATLSDPLSGATAAYSYTPDSQIGQISYGTGSDTRAFGYDQLGRLTSDTLKTSGGSTVASIGYGYDASGNQTSQATTGFAGAAANTYTYDQANRLTSWTTDTATTSYGYDNDGNLTTSGPQANTYNARDQITSSQIGTSNPSTFSYTARGTLSSAAGGYGTFPYKSDAFGQATQNAVQNYAYDALGRVVTDSGLNDSYTLTYAGISSQIASDGTSTYTYDPSGKLAGTGTAGGAAGSGQLAWINQHTDLTARYTPAATALGPSASYDPWGNLTATSGTMPAIGYQSGFSDPGTGLTDMGARWYWPAYGTFTSNDTIGGSPVPSTLDGGPYAYAGANPLTVTDPTGHCSVVAGFTTGGSVGALTGSELGPGDIIAAGAGALLGSIISAALPCSTASLPQAQQTGSNEPACFWVSLACGNPILNPPYIWGWGPPDYGLASAVPIGYGSTPYSQYYATSPYGYPPPYIPPPPPPQDCYAGPAPPRAPPPPPPPPPGPPPPPPPPAPSATAPTSPPPQPTTSPASPHSSATPASASSKPSRPTTTPSPTPHPAPSPTATRSPTAVTTRF